MLRLSTTLSGPLFDGRAAIAAAQFARASQKDIAEQGKREISTRLHSVIRHPTGRYESRIRVQHFGSRSAVNDSGMVYGPWLEGTGSRNRTTRFKGYATFRRVRARLQKEATGIARKNLPRYIRRMG